MSNREPMGLLSLLTRRIQQRIERTRSLYLVKPTEVADYWPRVAHQIQRAVNRSDGSVTLPMIRAQLDQGLMQLWCNADMVVVTQVSIYTNGDKYLAYIVVAGDRLRQNLDAEQALTAFGKRNGCKGAEFLGRPGWIRRKPPGFKLAQVLMRKDYE